MAIWKEGLRILDQPGLQRKNVRDKSVIIVGAGIAGLVAGKVLKDRG